MSDLVVNVRVGLYHFTVSRRGVPRVLRNEYHRGYPDGFFRVYAWPGRD